MQGGTGVAGVTALRTCTYSAVRSGLPATRLLYPTLLYNQANKWPPVQHKARARGRRGFRISVEQLL